METKTFDLQAGLNIQADQIEELATILKPEITEELRKFCEQENAKLPPTASGYQVTRGVTLLNYCNNIACKLHWQNKNKA